MIETEQTIEVEQVGDHFVASVPGIGATVTRAIHDEALTNALREIIARRIAEAEAEKRKQSRGKGHTGA